MMFKRAKKILKKKELDENKKDVDLEKGDFLAMMIALSYYMFPVLLGAFGIIALIVWLIFY